MLEKEIVQIWEDNILDYSAAVNQSRAIPDARTGLKPIHRKILYEMFADKITSDKKYKKCAYMVGQIIARFSEHGDAATYDALTRMAQPWIQRYPMIDFHGNVGSQFGDPQAAMRYTEAKLPSIIEDGMLAALKKNTVDWIPNFTNEEEEPSTLPALMPGLFCFPNQGIGFAVASNFLTFNLNDVADLIINYIQTGELKTIYYDLASGGTFINPQIMEQINRTGKGSIIIDAKYEFEDNKIVYYEFPFNVMIDELVESIAKVCDSEEVKGVKAVYNDSGKGKLRLVVETEKDANVANIINGLYAKTNLRNSYGINQVALVNNKPKLLTQKDMVDVYVSHNVNCISREIKFDLEKIALRVEILQGLQKALEDIDNIIALIRKASSAAVAKEDLIKKYNFTENQAKAILDMKLSRLANLERVEVNNELAEKTAEKEKLETLVSNDDNIKALLIERLSAFAKKYASPRRTEIKEKNISKSKEEKEIEFVEPEKCVVVMTEAGTIKRIPTSSFRAQKRNGKGVKTQEDITSMVLRTNTVDSLMIFSDKGVMYRLLVNDIPVGTNTSKGAPIKSLVPMEQDEKPATMYSIYRDTEAKYVMFVTKSGVVKKTTIDEYTGTKKKNGVGAIKLREGDSLAAVTILKDEPMLLVTANGYAIKFDSMEIGSTSRMTVGIKGINLGEGDEVIAALPIRNPGDAVAIFSEKGLGKKVLPADIVSQKRGGKGLMFYKPTAETGPVRAAAMVSDEDSLLLIGDRSSICIAATDIPALGRTSVGNQMIKNGKVIAVSKV